MSNQPINLRAGGRRDVSRVFLLLALGAATLLLSACGQGAAAWSPNSTVTARTAAGVTPDAEGFVPAGVVTPVVQATGSAGSDDGATPEVEDEDDDSADSSRPLTQLTGQVTDMPAGGWEGAWRVAGRDVHVTPSTIIGQNAGTITEGTQVSVEGWLRPDGSIDAGWITVTSTNAASPTAVAPAAAATPIPPAAAGNTTPSAPAASVAVPAAQVELCGPIEQLPGSGTAGDWRVAGRTVHVSGNTPIEAQEGRYELGSLARIRGWLQADGSINAGQIDVKKPDNNDRCQPGLRIGQYGDDDDQDDASDKGDVDEDENDDDKGKDDKGKDDNGKDGNGKDNKGKDDKGKGKDDKDENKGNTKWEGTLEHLPANGFVGTWTIGGRQVVVDPDTKIKLDSRAGNLRMGTRIEVKGEFASDGTFHAREIKSKD